MTYRINNLDQRGCGFAAVADVTPDGSGIVNVTTDTARLLRVPDASTVKGVVCVWASGDALEPPTGEVLILDIYTEGSATIVHEDAGTAAASKITTSTGVNVVLGQDPKRLYFRHDGSVWYWFLSS
jgi:hypothetical protein